MMLVVLLLLRNLVFYDMKTDAAGGNTYVVADHPTTTAAAKVNIDPATGDVHATPYVTLATDKASSAVLKFTDANASEKVRIEGKGIVDFNAQDVTVLVHSESKTAAENTFTFKQAPAASVIKLTGLDGVGAHKLTYNSDAANGIGAIEIDESAGKVELYRDPTAANDGVAYGLVSKKHPTDSVTLTGGVHRFSGAVDSARNLKINAPILMSGGAAAVNHNVTLNDGGSINKPILLDSAAHTGVITFDGGDKGENKYYINATSYKGDITGAANTLGGVMNEYVTNYNAYKAGTDSSSAALEASEEALSKFLASAAKPSNKVNFELANHVATYVAAKKPDFNFWCG